MHSSGDDGRAREKSVPQFAHPLRASATSRFCGGQIFHRLSSSPFFCPEDDITCRL